MLWTVGKLVPSLLELLSILFVPMYMGASLGHIFLGECLVFPIRNPAINTTNPSTAKLLAKWLPLGNMLQFDTPGRAMLDMFETANIASWNIVMDAGSALCGLLGKPLYFYTVGCASYGLYPHYCRFYYRTVCESTNGGNTTNSIDDEDGDNLGMATQVMELHKTCC